MTTEPFDVLVITALLVELDALLAAAPGGGWTKARDPSGFPYHHRRLGPLRIAAAWAGEMGEAAAATRAASLISHLDPGCLSMCGICAGNRADVFLGDVIIADRVYSYDHGKLVAADGADGRRDENFFHDIKTYNLDPAWRVNAAYLAQDSAFAEEMTRARPPSHARQEAWLRHRLFDHARGAGVAPINNPARRERCPDWTNRIRALRDAGLIGTADGELSLTPTGKHLVEEERINHPDHPDGHPGDPPFRVHVGPIATGKTVREDPEIFSRLKRLVRKTIGIEMEAAAIGRVADEFHRKAIIVKAVSDYGDHEKDDAYQAFAALAAAQTLLRFLSANLAAPAPTIEKPAAILEYREREAPIESPFHPAGSLPPGHATYIVRACDTALTAALVRAPLIAIEGIFSVGKSSLALRARDELSATHAVCYVDLQAFRLDDEHIFTRDFFELVSEQLGRVVDSWRLLDDDGPPPALIIDELGGLSPRVARSFIPPLVHFATSHKDRVRVIVCVPAHAKTESIESFLKGRGVENKYLRDWDRIPVPLLDLGGIDHLIALLPERPRALARTHADVVAKLSGGRPMAVQRALSALFDADAEGDSIADLQAILGTRSSYE